VQIFNKTV